MLTEAQIRRAPKKHYMNKEQLEFFRGLLKEQKVEAENHLLEAKGNLSHAGRENDDLDKAQIEEENRLMLRIVERETKLMRKIEFALRRMHTGEYGYCEVTGEAIGVERLLIRPTATMSADEKLLQEQMERNFTNS